MSPNSNLFSLPGRIGMSAIVIIFGSQKIASSNASQHYMVSAGVMAGGFLRLAASGAGKYSLEHLRHGGP